MLVNFDTTYLKLLLFFTQFPFEFIVIITGVWCREARNQHRELIRDCKAMKNLTEELSEECEADMKAKFGRIVDLEILEQVTVNRQLEEVKERLRLAEMECAQQVLEWQARSFFFRCAFVSFSA